MAQTISKVAKTLAINVETIRFYERRGLIEQPAKPEVGYRHYPNDTINRIRFIKRSQELGFTLNEIANLLNLNDSPCGQVQELAEHKLAAVKDKMVDLRRLEKALNALLAQCQSNEDDSHCPIIDSLQP
ncbi:Hg(II)-responsive transcriptional regulator [Cycloclasticus zancles]|uniref:Mercuric resistance operon regulatory protein n=1 Tax=Cycloclasticus zancles 78-ME TaxID=1198232 RepID=S5TIV2_9GAMM|nr:Hg(II)-responsive transcriptional regulator [Cycloclasticus zancles]AGS38555.1 MerR family transcriptional regulator [Cycloclasticus zancles 78-ME]AGS40812.1 MerR family transcriptional regulator [Cycloclasticus zancles 78-ME]